MLAMSQNTPQHPPPNAKVKRSRWKFFPKNHRQSPEPGAPEPKATGGIPASSDSAYGSSAANSGQNSENERSAQSSPAAPHEFGLTSNTSLTPQTSQQPHPSHSSGNLAPAQPPAQPAQPDLLSPQDALTQGQKNSHSNGDISVTSPTIRKEVHHDPKTGTAVTTITTTTTTTTTVVGPNGTTVIEEPRAELGDGKRTPEPSSPSEAVANAINGQGDGRMQSPMDAEKSQTVPGQWYPLTPGQRPIPQRGPDSSLTDLRRSNGYTEANLSGPFQDVPALPPRSNNGDTTPSTPARASRNFSYPTKRDSENWGNIPPQLRPGQQPQKEAGTMANLKMAAAGIHGAGEALRGTISQTAERHLGMGKASEAKMLKAQEVINKGRYEIENRKFAPQEVRVVPGRKPVPVQAQKTPQPQSVQPQNTPQPQSAQPQNTPQPQSGQPPNTPQPDGYPTHVDVSRRRFSTGYTIQPMKPKEEEPPPEKGGGGISKWLRKARSHPSDKGKGPGLREHDRPVEGDRENGKLRKRSKILQPVAE